MANDERTTITIAEVDSTRASGERGRLGVQATDNRWFGCFEKELWPRLTVGSNLNVSYKTSADGKYKNIIGILGSAASNGAGHEPSSRDNEIRRQVALKAAVEVWVGQVGGGVMDENTHEVITTIADNLLSWLEGHDDEARF